MATCFRPALPSDWSEDHTRLVTNFRSVVILKRSFDITRVRVRSRRMDSSDDGTALFKDENVIHAANRRDTPSLRLLHYNDVYHIDCSSSDPVGGIARFQTLCDYYRNDGAFRGQPGLLTLFSGDAFNPSLESAVTKGASFKILYASQKMLSQKQEVIWCRCSMVSTQTVLV